MDYLIGYSEEIKRQVHLLVGQNKLSEILLKKYSTSHNIRTDKALYDYIFDLKDNFIKSAPNPAKIIFDNDLHAIQHALGMHKTISRVQGGKLKSKKEIRIASLFKNVPLEFLRMVVVHELAHLKEQEHNKRFYNLCLAMEPDYHQIEFDFRLYQTHVELVGELDWGLLK
jgi:hypothetical protein